MLRGVTGLPITGMGVRGRLGFWGTTPSTMSDESQILIPPSFEAVHRDARGRLTLPRDDFRARYELCEDMANLLVEPSQALLHDRGLDERTILERTAAGLASEGSDFGMAEAGWVVTRLAELLNWPWPGLDALRAEAQAQAEARASRLG